MEVGFAWIEEKLRIEPIMSQDGEKSKQDKAIEGNKLLDAKTVMVRVDKCFMNIMKGITTYASAFELQYRMKFVQFLIEYIVGDMMLSNYLPTY